MWKVEIDDLHVEPKNGVSGKTGRPYSMRQQIGYLYAFDVNGKPYRHPAKVALILPDEQAGAYPLGTYYVHPSSVSIGRFEKPMITVRLMPAADFLAWLKSQFFPVVSAPASGMPARAA